MALARFGMDELPSVLLRQEVAFVDDHAGRRPRPGAGDIGDDAGQFVVEVGAVILAPALAAGPPVAVVAAFHHVVQARPLVAVVVVVGLPNRPVGVHRHLVRVAEIVGVDLEVGAVLIHRENRAGIERAVMRAGQPASVLGGDVEPLIPGVEPEPPVVAEGDGMDAVVVIEAAKTSEQLLLAHDVVVGVLGVDPHVGGLRHIDLVAENGDAERRPQFHALVKDLARVRDAVAVGVFQNDDPVALVGQILDVLQLAAVVDRLRDPNSPALVNGHVGRVHDVGLGCPERNLQPIGDPETLRRLGSRRT